jgi:murein DD-endopeptidase MepM/ murein hydrolase activator NlpD
LSNPSRRKFIYTGAAGLAALGAGYLYRDKLYSLTEILLTPKPTTTPIITPTQTLTPTVSPTPSPTETLGIPVDIELQLFHDYHGDGARQPDEPYITNASFYIIDETGNKVLADIKGNADGIYLFKSLKENARYRLASSESSKTKFRHVSISNEEFQSLDNYEFIPTSSQLKRNLALMNGFLTLPFKKGTYVSSITYFDRGGGKLPTYKRHKGTDFFMSEGTKILASAPGMVTEVNYNWQPGTFVTVNHGNGTSISYCHLSQTLVNNGQKVKRGEIIGLSGNTGSSSTPCLHFQLQYGVVVNQFNGLDPFSDKNSAWTKDNDPKYPISE